MLLRREIFQLLISLKLPRLLSDLKVHQVPNAFMGNGLNRTMSASTLPPKAATPGDPAPRDPAPSSAHRPATHVKARGATYPRNDSVPRGAVPDDKVAWGVPYPEYTPTDYTAPSVTSQPVWADYDIRKPDNTHPIPQYNSVDNEVDRTSHTGPYEVIDNLPRNPVGRTGVVGRGLLGRWGPNHAADPIVTRWKTIGARPVRHTESRKPVLQFIAIQRKDSGEWALPGGMVDPGETVNATLIREFEEEAMNSLESSSQDKQTMQHNVKNFFSHHGKEGMVSPGEHVSVTLKREFGEEAMNSLEASESELEVISQHISDMFKKGTEVYRGYVDDPRNTDNSWMETVAYNFHDETGTSVGRFKLHAGDDAVGVKWTDMDSALKLYASHSLFIQTVAKMHDAHW